MRIGLIEDDREFTAYLKKILAPLHSVETLTDGLKARVRLEQRSFDLLLIDIGLPFVSGAQLAAMVLENRAKLNLGCRVILISGDYKSLKDFSDRWGCPILLKPFSRQDLLTAIERS